MSSTEDSDADNSKGKNARRQNSFELVEKVETDSDSDSGSTNEETETENESSDTEIDTPLNKSRRKSSKIHPYEVDVEEKGLLKGKSSRCECLKKSAILKPAKNKVICFTWKCFWKCLFLPFKYFNCFLLLYSVDWVFALLLYVIGGWIVVDEIEPFDRFLPKNWVNSTEWGYPLMDETISTTSLAMFGFIPLFVVCCAQLCYIPIYLSCLDIHHAVLGMIVSLSIEYPTVGLMKILASSYRPNYKEYCEADVSTGKCAKYVANASKSFPSGHSSSIFVMMVYTSMYLSGKLGVFSERGASIWKCVCAFLPILAAIIVAISRTWDYYHRFVDITAGAMLGVFAGIVGYTMYFHSPFSNKSHHPKNRYRCSCTTKCGYCTCYGCCIMKFLCT